ncbi:hypothetical protein B0H13DRAFT_2318870 [Mycena leptocephala]|nr:hypothetical protein B0H13DRAFT_2318870 [Mycena leptocephala]
MSSLTVRPWATNSKTGKTLYDGFVEEVEALGDTDLGAHEIDVTSFPAAPDWRGNVYFAKADGDVDGSMVLRVVLFLSRGPDRGAPLLGNLS